jgi:hypothetical protein
MTWVRYTAKRGLAPFHVIDQQYTLELSAQTIEPSRVVNFSGKESLSGATETIGHYAKRAFAVTLAPVELTQAEMILEFLESTEFREPFTFDAHGSIDYPNKPLVVIRTDTGYGSPRVMAKGDGGANDWFAFSFQVRER